MTGLPDHYAALGIDPTADPEVITAAYRALAKKYHPDTGANTGTASAERFDEIQKAYEVLRNPESRHAYDLELLEATQRELEAHIASKRRVVVREPAPGRGLASDAPPPPDLGDIRPEPAVPPRAAAAKRKPRSLFPFVVPLLLMVLIGAGAAWLFLPDGPQAPPLPGADKPKVVAVTPPQATPAETTPSQATSSQQAAGQPAAAPPATVQPGADKPLFGSTGMESTPPDIEEAAATVEAIPAPDAVPNAAAKSDKPSFGSTGEMAAPAAAPDAPAELSTPPPPLPKAKPAQPGRQVAQQKTAPQKPVQQKTAQQQPRARLAYQDPPEYYPEPDGYPPPPPGMEPPGYDPADEMPPGFRPGGGPYRLVIFERQPGQQATAWSAGVVFKSIGKCTRQGVKAVLRRTAGRDPYADGIRVWYECQQVSLR